VWKRVTESRFAIDLQPAASSTVPTRFTPTIAAVRTAQRTRRLIN